MDMDFEKAFTFISEDSQWKKKLAIGGGLSFLSMIALLIPLFLPVIFRGWLSLSIEGFLVSLVIGIIIFSVLNLAIFGYFSITAHNRINNQENFLPEWSEFGRLIIAGIKTIIGHVLCFLPFIFISGILFLIIVSPAVFHDNPISPFLTAIFTIAGLFGYFVLYALLLIFYYLLFGTFLKDMKVLSFLNFKTAISLVKNNIINYLIFWLLVVVISLIVQFVSIILIFTIIGILLLPWVMFYSFLVSADVIAQFVKTSKE